MCSRTWKVCFLVLAISIVQIFSVRSAYADSLLACSAVFPDGISSNSNSGEVKFNWDTRIINSPDNQLDTKTLKDNSGHRHNSCNTANCSASGSPAPSVNYNDFPNNNNNVDVGYNQTKTIYPGNYKNIRLDSSARLTLKPGLYKVRGSISMGSSSRLLVEGDGVVRIMIKGRLNTGASIRINDGGKASQLLIYSRDNIYLASGAAATGFLYAKNGTKLDNRAHVQGAVSAKKVELISSASKVTYQSSEAAAANFNNFCGTASPPPPPPPPPAGGSCSAIWPDALQSHDPNGQVGFEWHSRAYYSPDNRIETVRLVDNSGGTSCNSTSCTATYSASEKLSFDGFKNSGGNNVNLAYNRSKEIGPGTYRNITLNGKSTLTLKDSGDYYITGNFSAAWDARIVVREGKKARLFINGNFSTGGYVKANRYGSPEQLLIVTRGTTSLGGEDQFRAVVYSQGNVSLGYNTTLKGSVSGKEVNLDSNVQVLYYKDSVNSLGDICKTTTPSQPKTVLDYRFDSCRYSSEVEDSSDSSYHGTPHAISGTSEAPVGNGLDLSSTGTSDWIDVPSSAIDGLNDFSVAVWVKTSVSKDQQEIIHALGKDDEDDQLEIALEDSKKVYVKIDDAEQALSSKKTLTDGNWHHVVITRKGRNACLYVDGSEQSCKASVGSGTLSVTKSKAVVIGQEQDSWGGSFSSDQAYDGYLDELKIYSSQLSADSIKALYDSEKAGADRGEVEQCVVETGASTWYQFDDCSIDSTIADTDGSNNATPVSVKQDSDGQIGKALDLSARGTSDWVKVPSAVVDGLDKFTIVVWIKTSVSKSQQEILHALGSSTSDDELELALKNSKDVYIKVRDKSQTLRSGQKLTDGAWHQLAITREGNTACLYVDGVYQECESSVGSGTLSVPEDDAVVLGQEQDDYWGSFSSSQAFEGKLDEFRIYNSKLNSTQISEFYGYESSGKNPDGSTRVDSCSVAELTSLNIAVSDGVTCEASSVTIEARDADDQPFAPEAGTRVTLGSDPGGQWSLSTGDFSPISYATFDGVEKSISLRFLPSADGLSTFSAAVAGNSAVKGSATANFYNAALKFYSETKTETIPTQIAGKSAGFKLRAIKKDDRAEAGVCVAAATGDRNVTFKQLCTDPNSCQTGFSIDDKSAAANNSVVATLNFNDQGWADFSYSYADAGKVKLTASMLVGVGITPVQGESNVFLSKPAGLCVEAVDAAASCNDATDLASCSAYKAAGKAFGIKVSGRTWESATEADAQFCSGNAITKNFKLANIKLDHQLVAPTGGKEGKLSQTSGADPIALSITSNGEARLDGLKLSEVGVFSLRAVPPIYEGEAIATSTSANIGRFTPAYFSKTDTTSKAVAACNGFSYMGQPFSVELDLSPKNDAGVAVENYTGLFNRKTGGTLSYGAVSGATDLDARAPSDLILTDSHIGGGLITAPFVLSRDGNGPDGPYDALNISLGFSDADSIPMESEPADGNADSLSIGTTSLRYGVLKIVDNSQVADDMTPLTLDITTQYWASGSYVTPPAGDDSCTSLTAANFQVSVLDDATGNTTDYAQGVLTNLTLGDGSTTGTLGGALNDINSPYQLSLSAPGAGNTGTLTVTVSPDAWLQTEANADPQATATFQVNAAGTPANDRVIYWLDN